MGVATVRATVHRWRSPLAALLALVALAAPAAAQSAGVDFPRLSGRVVDEAGILPDQARVALVSKLAALEAKTSDQLVVVTLRSLRGQTIERYGVALGRQWQIGQKGKDNGVLLIVAPNERKVRIEVGYGLEGTLTDAAAKLIIEQTILTRFRDNDYPGGIARGVDDIIGVLTGDADGGQRRAAGVSPSPIDRLAGALGVPSVLLYVLAPVAAVAFFALVGWLFVAFFVHVLIWIGALPTTASRLRYWQTPTSGVYPGAPWGGTSAGSFGAAGGFSGGGGSFGGGGASGSW
jgi:uncharacterized protein